MNWAPDILGEDYEFVQRQQPADYSGSVIATIIRRSEVNSDHAVLYVHGFSDYFLQHELGREINRMGYGFYAVDLRKYGRSHLPSQRFFEVRDLNEYFADISSAVDLMKAEGVEHIYLLGHSTGGLTASLFMSCNPDPAIRALILNSPFLAWNLSGLKRAMIPLISAIGRYFPNLTVPQPKDTRYAASLRRELGGEWDYRTQWKPDQMPDVDAGWVRAIEQAQQRLQKGARIDVPILLMTSARSAKASDDMAIFRSADGVLDVRKIRRAALALGPSIAMEEIDGGLHDLALSPLPVRKRYYSLIEKFLHAVRT